MKKAGREKGAKKANDTEAGFGCVLSFGRMWLEPWTQKTSLTEMLEEYAGSRDWPPFI
jgi:hypothetical protein